MKWLIRWWRSRRKLERIAYECTECSNIYKGHTDITLEINIKPRQSLNQQEPVGITGTLIQFLFDPEESLCMSCALCSRLPEYNYNHNLIAEAVSKRAKHLRGGDTLTINYQLSI